MNRRYEVSWINCSEDGDWHERHNLSWEEALAFVSSFKGGPQTELKIEEEEEYD